MGKVTHSWVGSSGRIRCTNRSQKRMNTALQSHFFRSILQFWYLHMSGLLWIYIFQHLLLCLFQWGFICYGGYSGFLTGFFSHFVFLFSITFPKQQWQKIQYLKWAVDIFTEFSSPLPQDFLHTKNISGFLFFFFPLSLVHHWANDAQSSYPVSLDYLRLWSWCALHMWTFNSLKTRQTVVYIFAMQHLSPQKAKKVGVFFHVMYQ